MFALYWCLGRVWTRLGSHQSPLLNYNQSKSGQSWRLPRCRGDAESERWRSCVSWGSTHVGEGKRWIWEPLLTRMVSILNVAPNHLTWTAVNTLRVRASVTCMTYTTTVLRTPTPLYSSPCVFGCSPELPTLCLVRDCTQGNKSLQDRKARRSLPSVGMKFRGPGSSGNARLAARRIQHIRNKEWEIPAAIATQLRILGTNTKTN